MWCITRAGRRREYFAGFKSCGPRKYQFRAKPRAKWSPLIADAVQFGRQQDAMALINGLRLFRLSPGAKHFDPPAD